jgi:FkbM family methyltransferase
MHLATRIDSSSLPVLGARQKAIYGMTESGELRAPIGRLDACLSTPLPRPVLLKIDIQGFELEVLKGGTGLLGQIDVV